MSNPLGYSPLTTTFTPPASCASEWTVASSSPLTLVDYIDGNSFYLVSTCYPPCGSNFLAYSPGLVCPNGYTTIPSVSVSQLFSGVNPVANYCCRSGFGWETTYSQCTTSFESTVVFSVDPSGITHSDLTYGPGQAWAWPILLFSETSDITTTSSSTGTSTSTSASSSVSSTSNPATTSTTSTATTSTATSSSRAPSGPSTGVKAGAVVGAILAAALLLTIIGLILRYRGKNLRNTLEVKPEASSKRTEVDHGSPAPDLQLIGSEIHQLSTNHSELQGSEIHRSPTPHQPELQGSEIYQSPTAHRPELQGSEIHQLPTPLPELQGSEIHQLPAGE